ncbi:MAG TPA: hypothetical protein VGJ04_05825 [Pirellulales bacterium]
MKARVFAALIAVSIVTSTLAPVWADSPSAVSAVDIKKAVPADAFLAIDFHHNPQRDDQRAHFADVWKTFQDEQIGPRLLKIITSRMPEDKLTSAKAKLDELQTAIAPINLPSLLNVDEMVVGERMEGPFNQVVWAVRLNPEDAVDFERGVAQTFELLSRWSDGKLPVDHPEVSGATFTTLALAKESPIHPAVARVNDIVLISTSDDMLRHSVEDLQNGSAKSKFDDPRLQAALAQLHKPDDSLVFFDGQALFNGLHGVGDFIRAHAKNDAKALRMAGVMDRVLDETAILDFAVTVQFTEPGHNHSMSLIKMADGYETKLLGQALANNKPLDNWQTWVPKDATAFSVHQGLNLHELYDGTIKFVREQFPESQAALDKFAEFQTKIGINFDRDILQSFTGQCVCVTMPVTMADGSTRSASVSALKCENPDKIRELLGRAVEHLSKFPAVQAQQLKLENDDKLEGFQQLHAAFFQMFGVQPVIGFRDGWMIVTCSPEAAEKLLTVRAGKADAIDLPSMFAKFGLDPKPALCEVSYKDIGASIRQAAHMIDKVGAMAPMFLGMAAANTKPEEIKPVQEFIGLLPSFAKVVRKCDFYDHNLSITRQGPQPGTYLQESVTEVHPPKGS